MGRKRGEYRLACEHVNVTISDLFEEKDKPSLEYLQAYADKHRKGPYIVCAEQHLNKKWHIHAYFNFPKGIDTGDDTIFQIGEKRCQAKACGHGYQGWINYCGKDGYYVSGDVTVFPWKERPKWVNYAKNRRDQIAYQEAEQDAELMPIEYPLHIGHLEIPKPNPEEERRHWILVGRPGIDIRSIVERTVEGFRVFFPSVEKQYRWERYEGEEIVVLDGVVDLEEQEMTDLCTIQRVKRQLPGGFRYIHRCWPLRIVRTVIVLAQKLPHLKAWTSDRFTVVCL